MVVHSVDDDRNVSFLPPESETITVLVVSKKKKSYRDDVFHEQYRFEVLLTFEDGYQDILPFSMSGVSRDPVIGYSDFQERIERLAQNLGAMSFVGNSHVKSFKLIPNAGI